MKKKVYLTEYNDNQVLKSKMKYLCVKMLSVNDKWFFVHHGMARPQVADGGTASSMEGNCEYIE
jgi:hypothetical protein